MITDEFDEFDECCAKNNVMNYVHVLLYRR